MATKKKGRAKRARSAKTGEFIVLLKAKAEPDKTVVEAVKPRPNKKKKKR